MTQDYDVVLPGMPTPIEVEPTPKLGQDARRTINRRALLANGVHPLTRIRLLEPAGATCGDCDHAFPVGRNRTYWKCETVGQTNGPGTDLVKRWPACIRFKAKP